MVKKSTGEKEKRYKLRERREEGKEEERERERDRKREYEGKGGKESLRRKETKKRVNEEKNVIGEIIGRERECV